MGFITLAVSASPRGGESNEVHHPCGLVVPKLGRIKWAPSPSYMYQNGEESKGLHHPYHLAVPKSG